ncbi:alcohol dehydrogenase [Thalassobacillus devorans]|uniref:Alcohol dehydrogenase n=1 Tax=Thalassobacillus devorans TaxID=279813 RepID=A0ABQ1NWA0_9BACI|nr:zinc-binding alcohol dehydrogenase [Thalassobacillus devorans]NIK28677.1 threonine dehydrogenase-like Zn-dependent dehydrogenase [Thalassobacillus devorans]GGC84383.1 alcohol dehydrogenase [Thalassobacillus devorans]
MSELTKTLIATEPRKAELVAVETAAVGVDEVKVKVEFSAPKHGTEVVDFRGTTPFMEEEFSEEWRTFVPRKDPSNKGIVFGEFKLGNMVVGEIIETGGQVTDFSIGDRVCTYGPISEYVVVKGVDNHRLLKMPEHGKWQNAVCYDPAQFALGAVRDANIKPGDCVAISGLGAIGQIAVQLVKQLGASLVVGIDPIEHRREVAREGGADVCFDPTTCDTGYEVKKLTDKQGVDAWIETSGISTALQDALKGIGYAGTIAYIAFAKPFPEGLNFGREAHFNNASLVFSRAASEPNRDYPRWDRKRIERTCWQLLMNGHLDCTKIIDPVVDFKDSPEAYMEYVDQSPNLSIKLGVKHG